ncbi:MIT domain-containing protein 1-like, partial [Anneissia japonica]|uniref:MIT domain-containing protein 1-like n=1 Tax=Anneissia japonica TaxID=1529436 RepID=UPI00142553F3
WKAGKAEKFHEEIQINDDSTGHSYKHVFGRFLDKSVHRIEVDDPYVRINHQILNFVRFCELVIKKCPSLKKIVLTTGQDEKCVDQQKSALEELKGSLTQYRVNLIVRYSSTLHDRAIRLDNGWTVKIGRGLDYFKPTESRHSIGCCDMDLRKCHETTINIFH